MSEVRDDVEAALSETLRKHGDMLVSWALCAVVVDADGERGMWALAPEGQKTWETAGLLTHALHREQAAEVERRLPE